MNHHYLAPPFLSLWRDADVFAAVEALTGDVYRQLEGRTTLRTEVAGQGYFVKIHRGIGWREIIKNLMQLKLPVIGASNEFLAIQALEKAGVATMKAVAFAKQGHNPAKQHSFIITEELAPTISLEDFCMDWPKHAPNIRLKRTLIRHIAQMMRQMHLAGVNHRDCYLCHFLLHTDQAVSAQCLTISLIDLHRAQIHRVLPIRWRDKDLAALYFSALDIGLNNRDKLLFLSVYFNQTIKEILQQKSQLMQKLQSKAEKMYQRQIKHQGSL